MILQVLAGILAALGNALVLIAEPRAALMDDIALHGHIQDGALAADALAIEQIEFRRAEGRGHLVLNHLDLGAVADDGGAVLELLTAAHIQAHGGVELQRAAAGGDLGVAVHHAHLFTQLVDKDHDGVGLIDHAGQLAQRLAHQPRLQADKAVAHLAVDFGARHQRGHGVHHHDIHCARAHQRLADFQRVLAGGGLADVKLVNVHAQLFSVVGIQRVLGVDKGRDAAAFLGLGHDMQGDRGFARGFGAVDLDDTALGDAAHAQGQIQLQASGGHHVHLHVRLLTQLHHGTLAKLLFQRGQRGLQRLGAIVHQFRVLCFVCFLGHVRYLLISLKF